MIQAVQSEWFNPDQVDIIWRNTWKKFIIKKLIKWRWVTAARTKRTMTNLSLIYSTQKPYSRYVTRAAIPKKKKLFSYNSKGTRKTKNNWKSKLEIQDTHLAVLMLDLTGCNQEIFLRIPSVKIYLFPCRPECKSQKERNLSMSMNCTETNPT